MKLGKRSFMPFIIIATSRITIRCQMQFSAPGSIREAPILPSKARCKAAILQKKHTMNALIMR